MDLNFDTCKICKNLTCAGGNTFNHPNLCHMFDAWNMPTYRIMKRYSGGY